MGPLHDGPGTHCEVLLARQAAEVTRYFAHLYALALAAVRAYRTLRPAAVFEVRPCYFLVRKFLNKFVMRDSDFHRPFLNLGAILRSFSLGSQVYNSRVALVNTNEND